MEIRRADVADLATLTELHRQFCEIDGHSFDESRAATALTPLLHDDRHGIVLITNGPAGYAVLTWGWSIEAGGAEAVLDEIYLTERGVGHGSSLIADVMAQAAKHGMHRVLLETEQPNVRVRGFYQRHGFVQDDSVWMSADC